MKRTDYPALAVDAAKSVLIELMHLLGEYRDQIIVVGGWVPTFITGRSIGANMLAFSM